MGHQPGHDMAVKYPSTYTYCEDTKTYIIKEDGEQVVGLSKKSIELETANNIDLTLRKFVGDFGFIANAFYNQVDDYYYQQNTGLFAEDGHAHHDPNLDHNPILYQRYHLKNCYNQYNHLN